MNEIIKPTELGRYGIPLSTAAKMRMTGDGPPYVKRGRSVSYFAEDVEAWLRSRTVRSTAEAFNREVSYR